MAGGRFEKVGEKVRAGAYMNFNPKETESISTATRGISIIPLNGYDWGPKNTFIEIDGKTPNANKALLGRGVEEKDDSTLLIREGLKGAKTVLAYILNGGKAATGEIGNLKAKAKYTGSRGNDIKVAVEENPVGGFDVTVYLDADAVGDYEGVTNAEDLAGVQSDYVIFSGEGELTENAGVSLTGGSDEEATNNDVALFLDACEKAKCNSIAFPFGDDSLKQMFKSKIVYMRESMGKTVVGVVANLKADYEGIINVTNSVELEDGIKLTTEQATAFVAGIQAGASELESNTYTKYEGAVRVIGEKNDEASVQAIKNGEFFFTMSEDNEVIVETDINSFTSFTPKKTKDYRKNKIIRVYDAFADTLKQNFPPKKYDNYEDDWALEEGLGRSILKIFADSGAIKNVNYDNDFVVNKTLSVDDYTVFDVGIQAVDASEKYYFNITTR